MFARYAIFTLIAAFSLAAVVSPGCDPCPKCTHAAVVSPTATSTTTATATATATPTTTATATPTSTPTPITPSNQGSGAVENGVAGAAFINCTAGSGLKENNLVILAISVLGTGVTITPPATTTGIPPWNLIDSETVNGDYQQNLYWHQVGSAETGGPSFAFTLSPSVRASCAAAAYSNTCLDDPIACTNPVFAITAGVAINSSNVSQDSAISFPASSLLVGIFGTTDTNSKFGDSATNPPNIAGTSGINQGTGPNMSPVNGIGGNNGGIAISNVTEAFAGTDGPWLASLPQLGKFPTIQLTGISGDGTTVTGTVATSPLLMQYQQPSFSAAIVGVTGGSPSGCFNGTFTVTPTGVTTFAYADSGCTGTGNTNAANIMIIDPGKGDNVGQVVSIVPHIP